MVSLVEKLFQMLINSLILVQTFGGFNSCFDGFLVILIILLEHFHQRVLPVFQSPKAFFTFSAVT